MKKTIILGLTVASIALSPLTVSANSDDSEYPAANFQPKVIYLDKSAASAVKSSGARATRKKAEFDPRYPAANFEPKIIFPPQ